MKKLAISAIAFGLMASAAHADSINGIQINGSIGGQGGSHTVVVDGVTCKLKNSTFGQPQGCNYSLGGGISGQGQGKITSTTSNQGCSPTCE